MAELLKREVSLTLLKVSLVEAGGDSPDQSVLCELQVTGSAEERGFAPPAAQVTDRAPSRRKRGSSRPTYEVSEDDAQASLSRTVAQWGFAANEVQLPVQYSLAAQFQDKPSLPGAAWLADAARFAASKVLNDIRADTLERFAAGASWLPSGKPMLPSTMTRQLQTLLPSVMREGDSLWLELAEPVGYLPLLPWEDMLRPVTPAPILRLSPHALQALSPKSELSVVLYLTAPSDKWAPTAAEIASLANAIRHSLPGRSALHVFADDLCHPTAATACKQLGGDDAGVRLHDLPDRNPDKDSSGDFWMTWVMRALDGRAVDILHCVAPGLLFEDSPRLVISRKPPPGRKPSKAPRKGAGEGARQLRYLTPFELREALTLLGAWGAVFSTPSRGSWLGQARMGLRLLVDQLARLRPGVAAFHDFEEDPACAAVEETYRFMIGDPSIPASRNPVISVYCHPARAAPVPAQPSLKAGELMLQYAKVKNSIEAMIERGGPLPAWVAATQRIVEQAVSRAAVDEAKGPDEGALAGLASALQFVEQMLDEKAHANPSQVSASALMQKAGPSSG